MINILKEQLSAEWNKPKAKNAKPGQLVRDTARIEELQAKINQWKEDELATINEMMVNEEAEVVDFNDHDLLGEEVPKIETVSSFNEGSNELT